MQHDQREQHTGFFFARIFLANGPLWALHNASLSLAKRFFSVSAISSQCALALAGNFRHSAATASTSPPFDYKSAAME